MSSCFINQYQETHPLLDTNNPYESVPSNKEFIHSSCDESNSSIISSDENEFEIRDGADQSNGSNTSGTNFKGGVDVSNALIICNEISVR
ncbi:hypothetical protein PV326_013596 [Microctonus aethiopoides]|nr:hypothetical protein PV326_013596 [Microctonus aethiopoides]